MRLRFAFLAAVAAAPTLAQDLPNDPEACRQRMIQAEAAGIIHGMDGVETGRLALIVDETLWPNMPFGTKLGMAKVFSCMFAEPGGMVTRFDIRGHLSNQVLGEWRFGDLKVK